MNTRWHHSPAHFLGGNGAFIVTASTLHRKHHFNTTEKLDALTGGLSKYAAKFDWDLKAWCVFSNHYHFVGFSPAVGAENLERFMQDFHSRSAKWLNKLDGTPGRKVWHNYWDTHLTFENSYYARLNYVHHNAVKHGLVQQASDYRWGSARSFEKELTRAQVAKIYSFPTDKIKILDDFSVPPLE